MIYFQTGKETLCSNLSMYEPKTSLSEYVIIITSLINETMILMLTGFLRCLQNKLAGLCDARSNGKKQLLKSQCVLFEFVFESII